MFKRRTASEKLFFIKYVHLDKVTHQVTRILTSMDAFFIHTFILLYIYFRLLCFCLTKQMTLDSGLFLRLELFVKNLLN